jgi:hypothetical protein
MFSIIAKLVRAIRVAFLQHVAIEAISKKEYERSLSSLKAIYRLVGCEGPSSTVPYKINILCGLAACRVNDFGLAISAVKTALLQIDVTGNMLSTYDKDYLRYYCRTVLEYCSATNSDENTISVNFRSLRFAKVRADLRRSFPITQPVASERG